MAMRKIKDTHNNLETEVWTSFQTGVVSLSVELVDEMWCVCITQDNE